LQWLLTDPNGTAAKLFRKPVNRHQTANVGGQVLQANLGGHRMKPIVRKLVGG
jgi:hypothetical protein